MRRAGCPIRRSPDRWLPAPPRSISPRGRVLPRPPTPRHPPCARLPERSPSPIPRRSGSRHQDLAAHSHRSRWARIASSLFHVLAVSLDRDDPEGYCHSLLSVHAPARAPQGPPRPVTAARPHGSDVAHCQGTSRARGARQLGRDDTGGTPSRPGGAAGIRTPDLRRARAALSRLSYGPRISPASLTPPGWARLDSNQGPRPYQGRALTT